MDARTYIMRLGSGRYRRRKLRQYQYRYSCFF